MKFSDTTYKRMAYDLLRSKPVHRGSWQSIDVSTSKVHATYELAHVTVEYIIPIELDDLARDIEPNREWADEHFAERVSGVPHNPPPSHVRWPYAQAGNAQHATGGRFSHTYPERFWPRHAPQSTSAPQSASWLNDNGGIRYRYGDLSDVVTQLVTNPLTRQAYLPVWFPEDTGATSGQRVPCTLGYHFLVVDGKLDIVYNIRSCDLLRHFQDDVYMAARLCQWMVARVNEDWDSVNHSQAPGPVPTQIDTGRLVMHIASLHAFVGDEHKLKQIIKPPRCLFCDNRTAAFDRTVCVDCADIP